MSINRGMDKEDVVYISGRRQWHPTLVLLTGKSPQTEEPGRLQSMGSLLVGHDWATWLSLFTFMHWRRKWQPTPVFLPGESQGQWSLKGCRLWGRRVGHDWSDLAAAAAAADGTRCIILVFWILSFKPTFSLSCFTFMHWRRKWQPTPVFLPGESQGRGSLMGCRLWGRTESDRTEAT